VIIGERKHKKQGKQSRYKMSYLLRQSLADTSCLRSLIKARLSTSCLAYSDTSFDSKVENKTLNRLKEPEPFINYAKQSENLKHFANAEALVVIKKEEEYTLPHPIWSKEEAEEVEVTHRKPEGFTDNLAYLTVSAMRLGFDIFSGYKLQLRLGTLDERAVLIRLEHLFLQRETPCNQKEYNF
jgi:hypothetical protein